MLNNVGKKVFLFFLCQERNIFNTAVLTGDPVAYDLGIYLISHDNTYTEVTAESMCTSSDAGVIKVSGLSLSSHLYTYCMYIRISHFIMIDMILNKRSRTDC